MKITLRKAEKAESAVVISLFNYYMYEFSDILGSKLLKNGSYLKNTDLIDPYWIKSDHLPYFIEVDGEIAGFVFVRKFPAEQDFFDIDQFFILKRYSRLGIGRSAFKLCIELHPGNWIVRVLKENERGLRFWENVISSTTQGKFKHAFELDLGVEMHFFRFNVSS